MNHTVERRPLWRRLWRNVRLTLMVAVCFYLGAKFCLLAAQSPLRERVATLEQRLQSHVEFSNAKTAELDALKTEITASRLLVEHRLSMVEAAIDNSASVMKAVMLAVLAQVGETMWQIFARRRRKEQNGSKS